jgi:hypothetical protein
MPSFETPQPISIRVELGVGRIRVVAGDRTDTVVDVRPSDPNSKADVAAAEQTRVELSGGRLVIRAPRGWRRHTPFGDPESIDVDVDVPSGSDLDGDVGMATLACLGRLGECRFKTGAGHVQLDEAGPVHLKTGAGDITVGHAGGFAEVTTGSGAVRVTRVDGPAVVKNSNGDTWIGEVGGDLRINAANGKIAVEQARETVSAKTAMGDIRLGEVERGAVVAQSGMGNVDVGILDGVPAWLDLSTRFGTVDNHLEAADEPAPGQQAVDVRVRTSMGDITVRRSPGGSRRDDRR